MIYEQPKFRDQYENFIGGEWIAPTQGLYFDKLSPVDGKVFTRIPRSSAEDIELAIDAAEKAFVHWKKTSPQERSYILLKIAERIEQNIEALARIETWENGKSVRENLASDIPYMVDQFRYFAGVIRADSGEVVDIDHNTISMEVHEPLGVVAQIIPWNFPLMLASWKIAPALVTGNCIVMKPAEQTPVSILTLMELIGDLLPPGVLNIVNGFGREAGQALVNSTRIKKISFTGSTPTGKMIAHAAAENIIPVTLELGGKSPNIFFKSIADANDAFFDKAVEGLLMFAFNQGEVCTCPSRALVHEDIYEKFIERALERLNRVKIGDPLDPDNAIGAQASKDQYEKILNYIEIGRKEGAEVLIGGEAYSSKKYPDGYYIKPTILKGHNKMRCFQEEIFGPVLALTTFKTDEEALAIANDTEFGLGSGIWSRDFHQIHEFSRAIEAGRVWVNCYHLYPPHASFGGYKKSGIGRETHKMMLEHYRNTKNILISLDKNAMDFF